VVIVCFRVFSSTYLGRLSLTSSPFTLGISRVVGFSVLGRPSIFFKIVGSSSHALQRHLQRLAPVLAASLPASLVDPKKLSSCASQELSDPSAFAESGTLFATASFETASGKRLLASRKARTLGFGYPFYELVPNPLEAYFSPQRSWVSLFRAFLPSGDRSGRFQPSFLRSCTSL